MGDLASISYVPTRTTLHPKAFLDNIAEYKTRHEVIFYSDMPVGGCRIGMANAEVLKGHRNKVALNNFIFLRACQIAKEEGLRRFIFLETDVRVHGHDWDGKIFAEAEKHGDLVCAGTPCVWNASEMKHEMREAVNRYIADYRRESGFAPPAFSSRTKEFQTRPGNHCLFIMGAGAVYDVAAMDRIFHKAWANPMETACQIQAFDLHIGLWATRVYGSACVEKMPWLKSIWSGYQNKVYDEEARKQMLLKGKVVLAHQFKCNDPILP